jgi:hypothetical protein
VFARVNVCPVVLLTDSAGALMIWLCVTPPVTLSVIVPELVVRPSVLTVPITRLALLVTETEALVLPASVPTKFEVLVRLKTAAPNSSSPLAVIAPLWSDATVSLIENVLPLAFIVPKCVIWLLCVPRFVFAAVFV